MTTKTQKRIIRAARKAKQLRIARWNNVPYMRSKFTLADTRSANSWSYAAIAADKASRSAQS